MEPTSTKGKALKNFGVIVGAVALGFVVGSLLYNDVVKRYILKK